LQSALLVARPEARLGNEHQRPVLPGVRVGIAVVDAFRDFLRGVDDLHRSPEVAGRKLGRCNLGQGLYPIVLLRNLLGRLEGRLDLPHLGQVADHLNQGRARSLQSLQGCERPLVVTGFGLGHRDGPQRH
jgi:hypothetical protein